MNNLMKWLLAAFGALWAKPLLEALDTVDPTLPLDQCKTALCTAVQGCHTVSGTLRGWICKSINATPDAASLAVAVAAVIQELDKYVPDEA